MENEVSNPTADESFSFKKITGAEDGNYYKAFVSEIEKSGSMNDAVKIANKTLNEFREAYDNSYFKKGQAGSTDEEIFNYIAQARKENRGAKGVACMEAHKSVSGAMKDAGYNVGVFQVSVIESGIRHSPFICNDGTNNYVAVDWDNRYEYKDMPSVLSAIRHSIKDASYNINTGIDRIFSNDGKTAYNDENLPGTDFGKNGKKVMQKPIDVFTDDTTPLDNNISVGIGCKGTATLFRETTRSLELNYSHDEGKDPTYGDYNTNSVIADYQAKTPIGKNGANAALYGKYEFSKVKTDNLVIKKQYDTWTDFLEKKQDFNVHSFNLGAQLAGKKHKLAGIESQSFVNAEYGGYVISDKPEVEYRKLYSISLDRDISVENNYINTAIGTKIQLGDEDSNYRASGAGYAGKRFSLETDCYGKGKILDFYHIQDENIAAVKYNTYVGTDIGKAKLGLLTEGSASVAASKYYSNTQNELTASNVLEVNGVKISAGGGIESKKIVLKEFPGKEHTQNSIAKLSLESDKFKISGHIKHPVKSTKYTCGINVTGKF